MRSKVASPKDLLAGLSFKLVVACNVKCGRGWKLPAHSWPDHRLLLVRGGCGRVVHATGELPLRRGQFIFGLPGEVYGVNQDEKRRLVVSVLRFEVVHGRNANASIPSGFRKSLCMAPVAFPLLEQLVMRVAESIQKLPCPAVGASDAILRSILWLLNEDSQHAGAANTGQIAFQELKPALDFPMTVGQHEPSVGELARLCGMSSNTFRRRMQECFGQSPMQFLLRRRMERAKQLLLETFYTVEAVSAELGYGETSHFCRQFKNYVGISPSIYRTSNM